MNVSTKLPLRTIADSLRKLLGDGLPLPMGLTVREPTGGMILSIAKAGDDIQIDFDESTLPEVTFKGQIRSITLHGSTADVVIDGLPDVTLTEQ